MQSTLNWLAKLFGHVATSGVEAMLFHAVRAGVILLAALWLAHAVHRAINRHLTESNDDDAGQLRAYRRIANACIFVPAGIIAVHVLGIDMTPLFATGGIAALAVGFGMRNFAENFISGVIIRSEKTMRPGNVLEVDGAEMTVRSIGLRSTTADTYGGRDLVIPNSDLLQSRVGTFTRDSTIVRVTVRVRVGYDVDPRRARSTLQGVADAVSVQSDLPNGEVLLTDLAKDAMVFSVRIWVDNPGNTNVRGDALRHAIWTALNDAGIDFAVPATSIRLDKGNAA